MKKNNEHEFFGVYNNLKNNDLVSTGKHTRNIIADLDSFSEVFERANNFYKYKKENQDSGFFPTYNQIKRLSEDQGISPELYLRISTIDQQLNLIRNEDFNLGEKQKSGNNKFLERFALLQGNHDVKLSKLFDDKLAMCSECSIVAQYYLQECEIDSFLCEGVLVQPNNGKTTEEDHHYLMIEDQGKMIIYDPYNTLETGMPRIYNTELTKDAFMSMSEIEKGHLLVGSRVRFSSSLNNNNEIEEDLGYGKRKPGEKYNLIKPKEYNEEVANKNESSAEPQENNKSLTDIVEERNLRGTDKKENKAVNKSKLSTEMVKSHLKALRQQS